ncbi:MAG TPA: LamG domain-containing protein [Thermoguttaceae bacterium]|nr:LamG domain-containing protein [Thermoguttaceae bacterium]
MNRQHRLAKAGWVIGVIGAIWLVGWSAAAWAGPIQPPAPDRAWLLDEEAGLNFRPVGIGGMGRLGTNGTSPPWNSPPQWSTYTPFSYPGNHSLYFEDGSGPGAYGPWAALTGYPQGTAGTISFWVADNNTGGKYILDATDGHRTLLYRYGAGYPENFGVYLNQTPIGALSGTSIAANSTWHHVALVWDNSLSAQKQKIYVNGNLVFTSDYTVGSVNPAYVYLGSRYSAQETWGGWIDEYALWNTPLSADQVAWLANNSIRSIAKGPQMNIPPAPTDAWFFDEGSGGAGTIVKPRWGNNPGTLYSNVGWTTDTPFVYEGNSALWFDGTTDNRVEFGQHTFGTAGSISIWAYRMPGAQYLFDSSPGARTLLYAQFSLFLNDTYLGNISNLLDDNRWTHLVITWDNSDPTAKQKIYKNGQLWATFNATLNPKTAATLWLGNRYSNNERWVGGIDEYALWDRALTPEEIAWLFQHSLHELPEPSTWALLMAGAIGLPVLGRCYRRRKGATQ